MFYLIYALQFSSLVELKPLIGLFLNGQEHFLFAAKYFLNFFAEGWLLVFYMYTLYKMTEHGGGGGGVTTQICHFQMEKK